MESEQILGLPYHESALRLCLDGFEQELLRGRIYGVRLVEPIVFEDMTSFLTKVDHMLDHLGTPQSYQRKRVFKHGAQAAPVPASFLEGNARMGLEHVQTQKGLLATATLRITSRQKATWQGSLIWEGNEKTFAFRSDLELMRHIHQKLMNFA